MALRSLARETWGPAACALRCRSGAAGMPAAASSRFLATTRNQVKQHSNGTLKKPADEEAFLEKELDKVLETLSQHSKDMVKLRSEGWRVFKIFLASAVGICSYSQFLSYTQPTVQSTSHQ